MTDEKEVTKKEEPKEASKKIVKKPKAKKRDRPVKEQFPTKERKVFGRES